ncbi:cryptochrome/photolyase family protein [Maritalea myrionectae]|uniref:cryptochrome/photolyase family protein n=1 Tax=Maritalea myrionectae TaxID=454601 RepID=UPI0004863A85|nr:deoxyribodipyrimidine photo-lyase [Maritalea myrionectae]
MSKTKQKVVICWFRRDLRLADNPALCAAHEAKLPVLPLYIDDQGFGDQPKAGGASNVWLHHALSALDGSMDGRLVLFKGSAQSVFETLADQFDIAAVHWNRMYEPAAIARDKALKSWLTERDIEVRSHNASLLFEPWTIEKKDGGPYKVFTPFYKKGCLNADPPRKPIAAPADLNLCSVQPENAVKLDDLKLLPDRDWGAKITKGWDISEAGARAMWDTFVDEGLFNYKQGRDFPAKPYVSRLSPYLHFGQISPHQLWAALDHYDQDRNVEHYRSELGWREFSAYLLYHFPSLPQKNFQPQFEGFRWTPNETYLKRWQRGQTGVPIVDAGMRELWRTGYMHNRVRMIVASYLTKNLRQDWRDGMAWFEDCLFDADLASNSASWQWVAGTGADAAPYFRVFNPALQGQKFDAEGEYIRTYVPELRDVPTRYLFAPWEAPDDERKKYGLDGSKYPEPMVNLKESRKAALAAYEKHKDERAAQMESEI